MADKTVQMAACELQFLERDVVHAKFNANRVVELEEVQAMFEEMIKGREGKRSLFLVSVLDGTTLSNDARMYASSEEISQYIAADAIIVRDFQHQLSANAFIRHNKPNRPVQTFEHIEKALEWLQTQREGLAGQV